MPARRRDPGSGRMPTHGRPSWVPMVTEMLFWASPWRSLRDRVSPAARPTTASRRSRASFTALPFASRMMSPRATPAFSAGLPVCTAMTRTPVRCLVRAGRRRARVLRVDLRRLRLRLREPRRRRQRGKKERDEEGQRNPRVLARDERDVFDVSCARTSARKLLCAWLSWLYGRVNVY